MTPALFAGRVQEPVHTGTCMWTLTGLAGLDLKCELCSWEQPIQHLQGRDRERRDRKKCRLMCTCEMRVRARLQELSGKRAPFVSSLIISLFVRSRQAEQAREEGMEGTSRAVPPACEGRGTVSNPGTSPRGSLSDWPFTAPCQS